MSRSRARTREEVIYLDHAASTPLDVRVSDAMVEAEQAFYANPHNRSHAPGRAAAQAVEHAAHKVADALGAAPDEILFTSGGTEANNLALLGAARARPERGHLVTCATEHASVLEVCRHLAAEEGFLVTVLPVDARGHVELAALEAALRPNTLAVSLMWVNNETGALHNVAAIAHLTSARGVLFHCDATQAIGRLPVDMRHAGVDLLTLSGHKIGGPQGIGALYVRRGTPLAPCFFGGGQQRGLRPGTLPVPLVVGLGEACELARNDQAVTAAYLSVLTGRLRDGLTKAIPGTEILTSADDAAPGLLSVAFPDVEAEALLARVPDLALSSGAACSQGHARISHVIEALGVPLELRASVVRFSLGKTTKAIELTQAIGRLQQEVAFLRSLTAAAKHPPLFA